MRNEICIYEEVNEMPKKVLMVATVAATIGQFNMDNIKILQDMGLEVHVACDFRDRSVWNDERTEKFCKQMNQIGVKYYQIDFTRHPLEIHNHIKAYKQLNHLFQKNQYFFVHLHTPIAGVIGRIVAHKENIRCIYTAHGFHFFTGAPIKNWIIYYPIEKLFSNWTDVLITINKEDYNRAKKKFHARKVVYIPGVGIDTKSVQSCVVDKKRKRYELGVPEDAFLLLSVGELHERKNQQVVIESLHKINVADIYYLIVGTGELYGKYESIIQNYGLENNIKLLGFRNDVIELCKISDAFIHPSIREGLGIAPLEAMACGIPLISSYVNGIKDYTQNGVSGVCVKNPLSIDEVGEAILEIYRNKDLREKCGTHNLNKVKTFDLENTNKIMRDVYWGRV